MHKESEHVTDTACGNADCRTEKHTDRGKRDEREVYLAERQVDGEGFYRHTERDEHRGQHQIGDRRASLSPEDLLCGLPEKIKKTFHCDLLRMSCIIKRMKGFIFSL